jgi:uncharacterized protein
MLQRLIQPAILDQLDRSPAVALLGPRQVGKTTLARHIASESSKPSVYLDLERPSDLAKLQDPELYLREQKRKLVILDEIQRLPSLFPILRSLIDERRHTGEKAGQFLLLGSASLDLVQGSSESLAGRISYIDLGTLNVAEIRKKDKPDTLWLRGGFPISFLAASDEESLIWREDFIASYLERDIPALGPRVPAETLRRFWTMLAHNQGQTVNAAKLAAGLGVSSPTISRYVDLLIDLLLARALRPWSGNIGKRLVKSPKIFIRDSGLVHALLGIQSFDDLQGHPVVGGSWEGFVIENLLSVLPRKATPYFYRTSAGAEIDLLVEIAPKRRIAVEIKRALTPVLSKGFYQACKDMDIREQYVVYPGQESYPLSKTVRVMSLQRAMDMIAEEAG